jgi:cytochrome c oxidase subunit 1
MSVVPVTGDQVEYRANDNPTILRRPHSTTGLVGWLTTVDHKRIGILYGTTAFAFFIIGGLEAILIRLQLAQPDGKILSANLYNQMFTMHGTTMIFLVVMPISAAFFNFFTPIMIGARDVAFPRLNAMSYWTFLLGGIFINTSWFLGGAPNGGWFGYAPNTSITFSPGHNIDFWCIGLLLLGVASTLGSINFLTTIINMRAPGMSMMRMPVFIWTTLVANFLLLFAMPIITIDLILLFFDRNFGSNFFNVSAGGDPLLWQHLFWLFGHPEVYVLILPAMGIVSEVLPVFARKPLFGYRVIVFSTIAIGFMGWGVWVHHMFTTGLGPVTVSLFSISTMFIAVPTGVKIFNWIATCWGGSIRFTTAMKFAIGFIAMFTIGGLSGVTHAMVASDRQQTDTYYIVAHFHYVLFGGALFGIMAGIYYWYPKVFGKMLNERLGNWHFWLWFIGFNVTFAPFHIIGLEGMPRRIYTYSSDLGLNTWNLIATIGAFIIALSVLVFLINVWWTKKHGEVASSDPWDARTLEWTLASPPPAYNFAEIPHVHEVDDYWHRKYSIDSEGKMVRNSEQPVTEGNSGVVRDDVHLPSPSFYPLVAAIGLFGFGYAMLYGKATNPPYILAVIFGLFVMGTLYAWAIEPSTEPHEAHEESHEPPSDELVSSTSEGANE